MIAKKNIRKTTARNWIPAALAILAVIIIIVLLRTTSTMSVDIEMSFSPYPGESSGAVIFALYYDSPEFDHETLRRILLKAAEHQIPLTIYFTAAAGDNLSQIDISALLREKPRLDFDIGSVLALIDETGAQAEIGTAGYVNVRYDTLPYHTQESLIKHSRKAFRDNGIMADSFLPPSLLATADTILAAENSRIQSAVIPAINTSEPLHPRSPSGIAMNLLLFPLNEGPIGEGINIIFITLDMLDNLDDIFSALSSDDRLYISTVSDLTARVRDTESISATLVTDPKLGESQIYLSSVVNGTKLVVKTNVLPREIEIGNESREFIRTEDGFVLFLDENDIGGTIVWDVDT